MCNKFTDIEELVIQHIEVLRDTVLKLTAAVTIMEDLTVVEVRMCVIKSQISMYVCVYVCMRVCVYACMRV